MLGDTTLADAMHQFVDAMHEAGFKRSTAWAAIARSAASQAADAAAVEEAEATS